MALTKEQIDAAIAEKRQMAERQRSQAAVELDSIHNQIQDATYQLSVTNDKLNAANEALHDKNAELKLRKEAFESANRAIYNDLASSEAKTASLMSQLEAVKAKNQELESEIGCIVSDISDKLRIYAANTADVMDKWHKSTARELIINDKTGLATLLQLNPGILVIAKDADGEIHVIDNRSSNVIVQNDSINTEKEGSVVPFRFIKPLKPIKSNRGNVITSLDSLSVTLSGYNRWAEQIPNGVTIEPSYGGVHLQIHKVGPSVTIWDDNRIDYTESLPTIKSAVGLVPHNFVIDGFLEVESSTSHLKKSEIVGMLLNNDSLLEQKSRFMVTDVLWMDNDDCHAESLESRCSRLGAFSGKYKNIVTGKRDKVYTLQDCMQSISSMCNTPNSQGAIMKHPDYTYGLGGTTTMAVEFNARKTINAKIIYATTVSPEGGEYIYDCAVLDDAGNEIYVGKTNITTFTPDTQALKIEFRAMNEFIDPATDIPHFNMIGAKVLDAVTLEEVSSAAEVKGFADMDETPVRYRALPEKGLVFTSPELLLPYQEIEMDCGCNKRKPVEEESLIDAEFKIKEQNYTIITDGKSHSKPIYHLLIQLPTKILDFVSTMNPINQHPCNMERSTATKMHWEVAGELPSRHKLNDGKNQKSTIATIDQGSARITADGDLNYTMSVYLKGDYINGMFDLARLSKHSDSWTFNTAGVN